MLNLRDRFLKAALDQHHSLQTLGRDFCRGAMTTFHQHPVCRVGKKLIGQKEFTALEAQPANMV